jgi:hypothetical protein
MYLCGSFLVKFNFDLFKDLSNIRSICFAGTILASQGNWIKLILKVIQVRSESCPSNKLGKKRFLLLVSEKCLRREKKIGGHKLESFLVARAESRPRIFDFFHL